MHIGILQAGHLPPEVIAARGDYDVLMERLFAGHGFRLTNWPVVDGIFPSDPTETDGWVITGSRHGAYEDLPWIPPLERFIREVHGAKIPLVGICFGHQIIAQALGGRVEKFDGGWIVGHARYEFAGSDVPLHAWHQDQVIEKPRDAEVVATGQACAYAALAYGDHILTVQAHPEFDADLISDLLKYRGAAVMDTDTMARAREGLGAEVRSADIANRLASVLKGQARG